MKRVLIIVFGIFMSIFSLVFLFIPIFNIDKDIYVSYNNEFKITDYNAYLRGKKVKIYTDNIIDTSKLGKIKINVYTKEKISINRKKDITIHIIDNEKPIININGKNEIVININSKYEELGASSIDNYDGDITENIKISNNIETNKLGEYSVNYEVSDSSNNTNIVTRKVIVKDIESPKITLHRKVNSYVIKGQTIDLKDIEVIDNVDGDITNNVLIEGNVDTNTEGLYKVIYRAIDSSNNETVLETTINVQNKNTKGIPVLMYHWFYDDTKGESYGSVNNHNYVSKTNFTEQIKYLIDNNYYFADYDELNDYIDNKIDLPEKSIILTDDDCVESFFTVAGEVIKEYKVPMTSFTITEKDTWQKYTNNEYIDFESHTNSLHKRSCNKSWDGKAMCSTYNEIYNDLQTANNLLKEYTNKDVKALAYPFGHYSDDFIKAIKDNNIKLAFTINSGKVKKGSNKYKLPRVRVSRTTTMKEFISRL